MAGFKQVPNSVFEDERLSAVCIAVYMVLDSFSGCSGGIFPSYETIAKRAHISKRTAIRVIKRLVFYGYVVKRKGTFKGTEKQASNYYILNPIPEIIKIEKNVDKSASYPHSVCQFVTPDRCQNVTPIKQRYEYKKTRAKDEEISKSENNAQKFPDGVGRCGIHQVHCVNDNQIIGQCGTKKQTSAFTSSDAIPTVENYMQ